MTFLLPPPLTCLAGHQGLIISGQQLFTSSGLNRHNQCNIQRPPGVSQFGFKSDILYTRSSTWGALFSPLSPSPPRRMYNVQALQKAYRHWCGLKWRCAQTDTRGSQAGPGLCLVRKRVNSLRVNPLLWTPCCCVLQQISGPGNNGVFAFRWGWPPARRKNTRRPSGLRERGVKVGEVIFMPVVKMAPPDARGLCGLVLLANGLVGWLVGALLPPPSFLSLLKTPQTAEKLFWLIAAAGG